MTNTVNPTQGQLVLRHLQKAPITPLEALKLYGVMRLASRINELRDAGHEIVTDTITRKGKRFAQYRLK
jgi:hypothetical protein